MKKQEKIITNITKNKDLLKAIDRHYDSVDSFIDHVRCYIKAIKENRMICNIASVSASGMSRTLRFLSCEKDHDKRYYYRSYYSLLKVLGYNIANNGSYFRINGCGMDMVFNTNYNNIHNFYGLGFISKKECSKLAQMTLTCI